MASRKNVLSVSIASALPADPFAATTIVVREDNHVRNRWKELAGRYSFPVEGSGFNRITAEELKLAKAGGHAGTREERSPLQNKVFGAILAGWSDEDRARYAKEKKTLSLIEQAANSIMAKRIGDQYDDVLGYVLENDLSDETISEAKAMELFPSKTPKIIGKLQAIKARNEAAKRGVVHRQAPLAAFTKKHYALIEAAQKSKNPDFDVMGYIQALKNVTPDKFPLKTLKSK